MRTRRDGFARSRERVSDPVTDGGKNRTGGSCSREGSLPSNWVAAGWEEPPSSTHSAGVAHAEGVGGLQMLRSLL